MLNNSEGGMDESGDFELEIDNDEVQNYQELLSQEDFCRFEEERQIQIG